MININNKNNIIASIILLLYYIIISIFSSHIIIITTVLINIWFILFFILRNRSILKKRIVSLPDLLYSAMISPLLFLYKTNYFALSISMIIGLIILYTLFRNHEKFPFHPILLIIIINKVCFPGNYIKSFMFNNNNTELFFDTKNELLNSLFIINSEVISYNMIIILVIIGIFALLMRKSNIYTFISFNTLFYLYILIFDINIQNIVLYFYITLISLFFLSYSNTSASYKTASLLSGIIGFTLFILLSVFTDIYISILVSIIITTMLNPYLDLLIESIKNRKIVI